MIFVAVFTSLVSIVLVTECIHVKKLKWMQCGQSPLPSRTLYHVTLDECADECVKRSYCDALRYWRSKTMCELVKSDDLDVVPTRPNWTRGRTHVWTTCIEVKRSDIDPDQCDSGDCDVKECRALRPNNAIWLGNMQEIGSKVKLMCTFWYGNENEPRIATCNGTGVWDNVPQCPDSYPDGFRKIQNWIMSVHQENVEHDEAETKCHEKGGYLVKIDTQEKQDAVMSLLPADDNGHPFGYWIQGKYQNGEWQFDDGTLLSDVFWDVGQPDYLDSQHCIRLMDTQDYSKWDNYDCDKWDNDLDMYFVCEYNTPSFQCD